MKTFSPVLESLEPRLAPAGVAVSFVGGALKITGTDEIDNIKIAPSASGFTITGLGDTLIAFNGSATEVASVEITEAITKGVVVDLKGGSDIFEWDTTSIAGGNMTLALGAGDNTVTLKSLSLPGSLTVTALEGSDLVSTSGFLEVGGKTVFNLGNGGNSIALVDTVIFKSSLNYIGGSGRDEITLDQAGGAFLQIKGLADFKMGAGTSVVDFDGETMSLASVSYTALDHTGGGESSTFLLSSGLLEINGSLTIKHGLGNSNTTVTAETYGSGKVAITHAGGGSQSTALVFGTNGLISGGLTITNGAGGSQLNSIGGGIVSIDGNLVIKNGAATEVSHQVTNVISMSTLEVSGSLAVTNATTGNTQVGGSSLHFGKGLVITNSAPALSNAAIITSVSAGSITGSSITINNTADSTTYGSIITFNTLSLTGGVTVKTGLNESTSSTVFQLTGSSVDLGGAISITNAGGGPLVNQISTGNLRVGGGIKIVNGPVNDTSLALNNLSAGTLDTKDLTITNTNGISETSIGGATLTITGKLNITNGNPPSAFGSKVVIGGSTVEAGSITVKNGNGNFLTTFSASSLSVKGALSVINGSTTGPARSIEFTGNSLSLGSLSLTNGDGDTDIEFNNSNLQIRGGMTVKNGNGADTLFLDIGNANIGGAVSLNYGGGNSSTTVEADIVSIRGAFAITALDGTDDVSFETNGSLAKGLTVKTGSGDLTTTLERLTLGSLSVSGPVADNLDVSLLNVTVNGATTLTGGSAADIVEFAVSTFRGAVKVDLRAEADTVSIDDSRFVNTLTLLTGTESDTVNLDRDSSFTSRHNSFERAVLIDLGTGADNFGLGDSLAPTSLNIFHSNATFNGGPEETSYQEGDVIFIRSFPNSIGDFVVP